MMMQISQLKPGFRVNEQTRNGEIETYEVLDVRSFGRKVEVTFRSLMGMESAVYMADAYLNASH